ncbi:MAG: preprotein translocase subunit SecE [Brachymonas sp.]|nr:preprotein translocase subunit SecE [Brachymonas sp.]
MATTSQVETVGAGADKAKIAAAVALVLAGFVAYFVLSAQASYVRWGALLAGFVAGVALFLFSGAGKAFIAFCQDAVRELRKVVWPTQKETLQTTLFVFVFVFLMSLFLWMVDKGVEWVLYSLLLGWR